MPKFLNSILLEGVIEQTPVLYDYEGEKRTSLSLSTEEDVFTIRAEKAMALRNLLQGQSAGSSGKL